LPLAPRLIDNTRQVNYKVASSGNSELFLSMVRWLAQEKVVTIAPRVPQERVLSMTASGRRNVFWFAVLLLPGVAVGAALYLRIRHAPRIMQFGIKYDF
jgi:hypothetical protein